MLRLNIINPRIELLRNNKALYDLYELVYPDTLTIAELAKKPILPAETTFLQLTTLSTAAIINYLGIIIPPNIIDERQYVLENLPYYVKILLRQNVEALTLDQLAHLAYLGEEPLQLYFMNLTDTEMLHLLGIMVPFESKLTQFHNTFLSFIEPTFFYIHHPSYQRSINAKTLVGNDIMTPNLLLIGFGTPLQYYSYELADFANAIRERTLYYPENPMQKYTFREMRSLHSLLYFLDRKNHKILELFLRVNDISTQ